MHAKATSRTLLNIRFHVLMLIVGFWVAISGFLFWDHHQEVQIGQNQSETLAHSLATHAEQVLADAERISHIIENKVRADGISTSLIGFLPAQKADDELILQLSLVDTNGILRASTTAGFSKINLSDREHIKVHLQDNYPGMFISKPLVGRASKRLSLQLSTLLRASDGKPLGVLVISIDPNQLTERYRQLNLADSSLIALIGSQDRIVRLARGDLPDLKIIPGERDPGLLAKSTGIQAATFDPSGLLLAVAKVNRYPLAIVVGLSRQDYLSPFGLRRNILLGATLLITLLTLVSELRHSRLVKRAKASDEQLSKALQQVLTRERRLAELFRAIPDPAIAFARSGGYVTGCNPPMSRLLTCENIEMGSITLEHFADLVFAADVSNERKEKILDLREKLDRTLHLHQGAETNRFEIQIDTPAPLIYEVRAEPMPNEPAGILVLLRDITAQHRLERMTNDFDATAAHELRTPLASILGFSELMAADLIPDHEKQKVANQIYGRAKGMSDLVNDLLTLTRLETGRGGGQFRELGLRDLIDPLLQTMPEAALNLSVMMPDEPVIVDGNMPELISALRNALENALKYGEPEKGLTLRIWADTEHRHARMTLEDQGPGIRLADLNRIFKRFVRINPANTVNGSGLGLALVRGVLQHHKGWAWAESGTGSGFKLHLSLPLKTVKQAHDTQSPTDDAPSTSHETFINNRLNV